MPRIFVTWHLGSKFQVKGNALPLFFLLFLFLPPVLLKEGHFLAAPRKQRYWYSTQAPQHSDMLTWPGTCTKISQTLCTKELNSKYYKVFLPRNIK